MNKYMKKITLALAVAATLLCAFPACAATTGALSPTAVQTGVGQSFTLTVAIDAGTDKNFAEKIQLTYPANIVEVTSFTLAPNWVALTQSGYDSTDNSAGVLVKTAGYPTGFSGKMVFGTVTFHAKNAGTGVVSFGQNSASFLENSQTPITGASVAFTVSNISGGEVTGGGTITNTAQSTNIASMSTKQPTAIDEIKPQHIPLAAAVSGTGFPGNFWLWVIALIVLIILAYTSYRKYWKKNSKNQK